MNGNYREKRDMETGKRYERTGDMSPDDKLVVVMQDDGDIQVKLRLHDRHGIEEFPAVSQFVEFCTLSNGGGRSLRVREALQALAEAIEKDNEEWPIE